MKYVLGGGLSGLVAAYYNPEYTVVSPEFGGFIDSKYGRAFVVLHATPAMRELFGELDVPVFEKRIQIGYYDGSKLQTEWSSDDEEKSFARRYTEDKLPPEFQPGKDLELSAPGDEWEALFVDSSIVDALAEHVRSRRKAFVESISFDEIRFESGETVDWSKIVSTLPATAFRRLTDVGWSLEHEPTTYAELPREKVPDRYFEEPWNLLYTVDSGVEYHRVAQKIHSRPY
jgi:hypothetical protein